MDLKNLFIQEFNMNLVAFDLMEMIEPEELEKYIIKEFKNAFTQKELLELFEKYDLMVKIYE